MQKEQSWENSLIFRSFNRSGVVFIGSCYKKEQFQKEHLNKISLPLQYII